ncbi:MAG: 2-oxo-4-hydroxy-4-carboxy-5-ureidoimidazoline decarboxylase [Pseudorhodoplanes sp.]
MPPAKTPLDELNSAPRADFVRVLGDIFEHAAWVADQASAGRPFATVQALHDAMMRVVSTAPLGKKLEFLRGHPDLAGSAARAGTMAAASVSEQSGLGLDSLSDAEYEDFQWLNAAYREKFGFPFIICVRRQTRDAVLAAFRRRLRNTPAAELAAALEEISHITRLRLSDAVQGAGMPNIAGHLSTHVLDAYHGEPAAGVALELFELGGEARARIASAITDDHGRTDQPLVHGEPLRAGRYEIVFYLGDYFRRRGVDLPDHPFVDDVVLRFGIDRPEGRYHVPVVATPWSYSTYRGS